MRILYGGRVLYDPVAGIDLLDVQLTRSLRAASELSFKMPATHECAGIIELESVEPEIEAWEGARCLMRGRAYACEDVDDVGTVEYRCEGELAYLNDTSVRPYSTVAGEAPLLAPSDPYGYFEWLVDNHNAKVEPAKQFRVGVNQGHLLDDNDHILRSDSTYPSTGLVIREKLLEKLGGFVRARYVGGARYVDYLADTDGTASQRIEFGANLLKFARTRDGSPICSAVIPLGSKPEGSEDRITIAPLGNGDADVYGRYEKRGDAVVSVDLVSKVGYRERAVVWDDVTDPAHLVDRALSWLPGQANEIETVHVKAYDLSRIDPRVQPIELGDYVRVTSAPHGYDSYMIVSRIVHRPTDWQGDEYVFGVEGDDIGDIVRKHAATLNAGINGAYEAAEAVDKIAKDAAGLAQSALDALADLHGAYVHIRFSASPDGVPMTEAPQADTAYMGICSNGSPDGPADPDAYSWARTLGSSGEDGVPGAPGADGAPSYLHVKWSESPTGDPMSETPGPYMGTCVDSTEADPIDPALYTWTRIKGDKGDRGERGLQGLQGEDGAQGMPGKPGADGKPGVSSYTHIAYSNSADGTVDFSLNESDRAYIGMYVDSVQEDSSTPSKYAWSKIKGADGANGTPGKPGEDGKTPYLHIAYANSADGTSGFSTTDSTGKLYIGQYTDHAQADSSTPSMYAWTKIKGEQGPQGKPGANGQDGADGKTLYGTCSTAAATAAKAVSDVAGFSLYPGAAVAVTFSHSNTASLPTLDVNGSGAKRIMINGANAAFWVPGSTVPFVYDGTAWQACNAPIYGSTATIGSPSGGNVYVDGDSVSVRQGTTVLARLKAGLLELAANSANAVIKLCGGKGAIAYYAGTDQLAVMAPGSIALAACQTLSDGTVQPYDSGVACNRSGVLLKGAVEASGTFRLNGGNMADFVVAQGTSGIWRWRKWASGFAECWGATSTPTSTNMQWGGMTYDGTMRGGHALPFALTNLVHADVVIEDPGGGAFWPGVHTVFGDKAPKFFVLSVGNYSRTVYLHYYVTGTWR
ncbi:phage tail protein [Paraeggerthella sp. Marseille-Q4926]|uniref:phage tail protein n=1 Tax=Paraeggerthella sp. Marseille-Q4926 TaxID=2866587 RepID=UPI001CE48BC3|nr:phage tail protein [Paraeggerthella sp. Marseille-Q4926]